MTTNLVAFNLVATAHFLYGSLREERHLNQAYGAAYTEYQRSGVPFYLPGPATSPIGLDRAGNDAAVAFSQRDFPEKTD